MVTVFKQDVCNILSEARKLIENENTWCTQAYARDENGAPCDPTSNQAVCWCAFGALYKMSKGGHRYAAGSLLIGASTALFDDDVTDVNDSAGHAAVLRMYDHAIQNALADEILPTKP